MECTRAVELSGTKVGGWDEQEHRESWLSPGAVDIWLPFHFSLQADWELMHQWKPQLLDFYSEYDQPVTDLYFPFSSDSSQKPSYFVSSKDPTWVNLWVFNYAPKRMTPWQHLHYRRTTEEWESSVLEMELGEKNSFSCLSWESTT